MKIDKSAVIDIIDNLFRAHGSHTTESIEADVLEAINALPASEDEWVSVDDRLPEHWEEVDVYLSGNVVRVATYIANDGYKGFYSDITTRLSFSTVTHWQPLPSPRTK